jgi:hypothetical protein
MFDMSCQPAVPLVGGIPIAVEQNQDKRPKPKKESSMNLTYDERVKEEEIQIHEMPVTVLVPNSRCQVPRSQLSFN